MLIAIVLILLVIGSVIFHFVSPWWFTPIASNWGSIDTTINITFWVTGTVFILVNLFLALCIIRFRYSKDRRADYNPENKKLELWLTLITAAGVAALLAPGLIVWADFVEVPEDSANFEVVGSQWQWRFRFPGEDGILGLTDAKYISIDNPFGMHGDDPNGQDDILIRNNTVHLPIGEPVNALLRSTDVLHNFAVPQFRAKMDIVPGLVSYMWFEPTRKGTFEILCEELCGVAHYSMRGKVTIEERSDFDAWLASQPTYADTLTMPAGDVATGLNQYAACAACHGTNGEGNQQLNAPKLAGMETWYLTQQLNHYKAGIRGTHEDDILGQQMRPLAMTLFDDASVANVVAYIQTLPDNPAPTTIQGDIRRGAQIYTTCASCHGKNGQGIWSINAPRQAGMSDWYLANQLRNFKSRIRGGHPDDGFGWQMSLMADILNNDKAINDVVAYINTL
ncbi:MAG: cytochrome-c oxidase [Chromatiales bacterium]|jgi:cytochrome c oxidase subunit 2|nr:cytochrome-c oxidase [Chromatiales bacterium]